MTKETLRTVKRANQVAQMIAMLADIADFHLKGEITLQGKDTEGDEVEVTVAYGKEAEGDDEKRTATKVF